LEGGSVYRWTLVVTAALAVVAVGFVVLLAVVLIDAIS